MINNQSILITGGTGSFGNKFCEEVLNKYNPKKLIIYSRDEFKQSEMRKKFINYDNKLRYFIGDVRDYRRLDIAMKGVDIVIHAAALKQVPAIEYNATEAIQTNVIGAENVRDTAIRNNIKKVIALSTDKAVNPINTYGFTKGLSDKIFITGNAYAGKDGTKFSIVRYGNVAGSRGSIVPLYKDLIKKGNKNLPVTHKDMTRFWITLSQAVDLVFTALKISKGGETFISKIPSFYITTLVKSFGKKPEFIGVREGEKLHECMITEYDNCYEYKNYYVIYPNYDWWNLKKHFISGGTKKEGFNYSSNTNDKWLNEYKLSEEVKKL